MTIFLTRLTDVKKRQFSKTKVLIVKETTRIMTKQRQRSLMYNVFGIMMVRGYFENQQKMIAVLKAIYNLLGKEEGLSAQECDDCLLYFFQEYAKGCNSQSITDTYIRQNMIPVVKNFPYVDMEWGISILIAAKAKIK